MSSTVYADEEIKRLMSCVRMVGIKRVAEKMDIQASGLNNAIILFENRGKITSKLVRRINEALKKIVGTHSESSEIEPKEKGFDDDHDPDVLPLLERVWAYHDRDYVSIKQFERWLGVYLELTRVAKNLSSQEIRLNYLQQCLPPLELDLSAWWFYRKLYKKYRTTGLRSHKLNYYLTAFYALEKEYGTDKAIKMVCVLVEE